MSTHRISYEPPMMLYSSLSSLHGSALTRFAEKQIEGYAANPTEAGLCACLRVFERAVSPQTQHVLLSFLEKHACPPSALLFLFSIATKHRYALLLLPLLRLFNEYSERRKDALHGVLLKKVDRLWRAVAPTLRVLQPVQMLSCLALRSQIEKRFEEECTAFRRTPYPDSDSLWLRTIRFCPAMIERRYEEIALFLESPIDFLRAEAICTLAEMPSADSLARVLASVSTPDIRTFRRFVLPVLAAWKDPRCTAWLLAGVQNQDPDADQMVKALQVLSETSDAWSPAMRDLARCGPFLGDSSGAWRLAHQLFCRYGSLGSQALSKDLDTMLAYDTPPTYDETRVLLAMWAADPLRGSPQWAIHALFSPDPLVPKGKLNLSKLAATWISQRPSLALYGALEDVCSAFSTKVPAAWLDDTNHPKADSRSLQAVTRTQTTQQGMERWQAHLLHELSKKRFHRAWRVLQRLRLRINEQSLLLQYAHQAMEQALFASPTCS